MKLDNLRAEIEHMRRQVHRQRKEIQALQRAGISTVSAEELLARMLTKVDELCAERDELVGQCRIAKRAESKSWSKIHRCFDIIVSSVFMRTSFKGTPQ